MSKITALEHLRVCAESAKQYAMGAISEMTLTITEAITELASVKAEKSSKVSITIPITGWRSDSNTAYPRYYDITVTGLTVFDRADVMIAPTSLETARFCGMCLTSETFAGKIRVRAASIPAQAITAEYWIQDGKEK